MKFIAKVYSFKLEMVKVIVQAKFNHAKFLASSQSEFWVSNLA